MNNSKIFLKCLLCFNFLFFALFFSSFAISNQFFDEILYLQKAPFFSDFYDLLNNYLANNINIDSYNQRTFYLLFSLLPESILPLYFDKSLYSYPLKIPYEKYIFSNIYVFILYIVFSFCLFFHSCYLLLKRYIVNLSMEKKILILISIIFSYPIFFGFLRGNSIILACAFLNYFLYFHKNYLLSLIFGTLAVSIKIYFIPLIIFIAIRSFNKISNLIVFLSLMTIYLLVNQFSLFDFLNLFDLNFLFEKSFSYWRNFSHIERYNYNISLDTFFHFLRFMSRYILNIEFQILNLPVLVGWRFIFLIYIISRLNKILKFLKEEKDIILITTLYFIFLIVFSPYSPIYFLSPLLILFFISIERYKFNIYIIIFMIISVSFKRFILYPYPLDRYDFLSLDGLLTSLSLILIFIYIIEKIICKNSINKNAHYGVR